MKNELDHFFDTWDWEARGTANVLRAIPSDQYDFRPDPGSRSMGELAWHFAEIDGYFSRFVADGKMDWGTKYPGMERPRTVEALAPGYEKIHAEAVERLRSLKPEDLDRKMEFFDGQMLSIRQLLQGPILRHAIHHRGQLTIMLRMVGAVVPSVYGPNREQTVEMKAAAAAKP